ncbi:MAG: TonB-dependent receptor plug domain-containing protein [Alistipes sp.]|nr:TonB-dependent receptor plug domain-containing protein [Alistipes sp.]
MKHLTILFLLLWGFTASAQTEKIPFNGELLDLAGKPIRTARIYTIDAKDYALSDREGRFGLSNVGPNDTLKIVVKKALYRVPVAGKQSIRIRLAEEQTAIQTEEAPEFVSLGYGWVSRRERTNATNYISGDELRKSGYTDIISALQGRVPGLDIVGSHGNMEMTMRGTRSFKADSTPAFVVDGVIVPSFQGINLNDVDYVEVMKEATVYGSQGANGAILVHTKMAHR